MRLNNFCGRVVSAASDPDVQAIDSVLPMPFGMCTWASFAGGGLLTDHGFGTWKIWNATRPDGFPAHDWLVQGALFVDLTAHQFDGYQTFIVGRGVNPLVDRFPRHQRLVDTSLIADHPPIVAFKEAIGNLLGAPSQ